MLLKARSLAHFYGSRLVFKGISFDLRPGTVTILAGANGAGKSTLLKILAGLIRPSSGAVETQGAVNSKAPTIAYLGHQTFIYPELTALENLRFWACMHSMPLPDSDYVEILERVELAHFAEEKAKVFSRGMAQRLNLARVFLLQSDILLLDEPGTGLDMRSAAILLAKILSARERGSGILWITHNLREDLRHADQLLYLKNKTLDFSGSPDAFQRHMDEETVATQPRQNAEGGVL